MWKMFPMSQPEIKTCDNVSNFFPTHIYKQPQTPISHSMSGAPFRQYGRGHEVDIGRYVNDGLLSSLEKEAQMMAHLRKEQQRSRKHDSSHFPRQEIMSPFLIKRKQEYDSELEVTNAMFPCAWAAFDKNLSMKSMRYRDSNPCR